MGKSVSSPLVTRLPLLVGDRILLTLWVGGLWAIGYIAAPVVFQVLDDRLLAGLIAGRMFSVMGYLGLVCGSLLMAGLSLRRRAAWRHWRFWALAAMVGMVAAGQFGLQPVMEAIRDAGFAPDSAEAGRFGRLHGIASALYLATSLLGLALVAAPEAGDGGRE